MLHTATLLSNGKVLVAGGYNGSWLSSAELYDPSTGTWTATGSMNTGRTAHTATLLPNGKVLVAGGWNAFASVSHAELYDPAKGTWTTGMLTTTRYEHTATLLPNGKVLVAGGYRDGSLSGAELYDPANGTWTNTVALTTARNWHTATLLPNGKVLVAGGWSDSSILSSVEQYDVGLGFNASWQPQIATFTSPLSLWSGLAITGSKFRGISEGSGGNTQNSPADYPVVQLRSVDSGRTTFLLSTDWSTNSFTSAPVTGFPPGYALATVFVNGIPSPSGILNISIPVPTPTTVTNAQMLPNGSFQFALTNTPGALFGVLATTDLSLPLTNWTALGGVTEIAAGRFQFTDPQATNYPQRFYRVISP